MHLYEYLKTPLSITRMISQLTIFLRHNLFQQKLCRINLNDLENYRVDFVKFKLDYNLNVNEEMTLKTVDFSRVDILFKSCITKGTDHFE